MIRCFSVQSVAFVCAVASLILGRPLYGKDLNGELARIMHDREGAAVVADVGSGRLLAAYHPEVAARRLARPGSAFKPFTLLALLQAGKLSPTESFLCRRTLVVGKHNLSCSHPQTGPLQASSALAYSCNGFFATFGLRLSATELKAVFDQAGLASPSGLLAGEAIGFIRPAPTEEERQLQAVGEEGMRVTPLGMLAAYRLLALRRDTREPSLAEQAVFSGLEQAMSYGMARLASIPEIKAAGKTGTPQSDLGSWTNGWFAGYAPADKPEVVVVVFVERGSGPDDAAPLAGEIFRAWHKGRRP